MKDFFRKWMLPLAITVGVLAFLLVHFLWKAAEGPYMAFCGNVQPVLIGLMLFLQLNLVAPSDLRFHRWHFQLLGLQAVVFAGMAALAMAVPSFGARTLLESVMLCFICPTAAAAGVITMKLGGNLAGIMTYTVMANLLAAVMIPSMVPLIHPAADAGFWVLFFAIIRRVFSILVLPLVAAWLIRFLLPRLQKYLERFAPWAFYIWGCSLLLSISLATSALVGSGISVLLAVAIGVVSLGCCLLQFLIGRRGVRRYGHSEAVTAGQALGQKNTGFIIWLGVNYMTPVTSIAGGLYAVWHNLVNSWQLMREK